MKKIINFNLILFVTTCLSSCILEDVEPEYDIVGGVATVTALTPSTLVPLPGQTMTVTAVYYSEHAPVVELRFYAKVGGADRVLVETVPISNHNTSDSYSRTFDYTIPNSLISSTVIVFTIEVETPEDLFATRSTPSAGNGTVITPNIAAVRTFTTQ